MNKCLTISFTIKTTSVTREPLASVVSPSAWLPVLVALVWVPSACEKLPLAIVESPSACEAPPLAKLYWPWGVKTSH
jgi:hypothetical protein